MDRLFLGVDAGGSKTEALLVNESGQVIGEGRSGAANYHIVGLETALARVKDAAQAALGGRTPEFASYCLTAADMPHDFAQLGGGLKQMNLSSQFSLHNDVIGIFRAGSRFSYGVGLVFGTGFNAGGIAKDGREVRLPALGPVTGDFAGGGAIGVGAIGAAFRAWDGRGAATRLQEAILAEMKVPDMDTIAELIVQKELEARDFYGLAPLVFQLCEEGDAVAQSIIREQGEELGISALAILRRLDLLHEDCDVVIGGRAAHGVGSLLLDTLSARVQTVAPQAKVQRLDVAPVVGAVLLAAERCQISGEAFVAMLRNTLPSSFYLSEGGK